ncbi:MAG TPA: MFS transporter [Spirochaetales bacterium]|nr:MFS transporter [Spirochaetales bacterium]HRY53227.1 MFS transporter [Spirochaetia bacterium]HRZ63640.1 MFS transporter [Spirochaetia bacterium]
MERRRKAGGLSPATRAGLFLFGFSGQLAWAVENQFFNTFLYDEIMPDPRPISWMVAITAVVSFLTTVLMGTLSDRSRSARWGRRKLFLVGGYLAWGAVTALFPLAAVFKPAYLGVAMAILFDCVMTFFGATSNDAAFNAYVTDITTVENRGSTLGALEALRWIALLVTYGGAGFVVQAWGYSAFFWLVGGLVVAMGLAGGRFVREPEPPEPPREGYWRQIAGTFRWEVLRENRNLLLVLVGVAVWNLSFNVFFSYLLIYLQRFLELDQAASSALVAVAILVGGIAMAYPLGRAADKWGRKPLALLAVAGEFAGLLLFSFSRSFPALVATGVLWILPIAAFSIATGAWCRDLFPEESRAQFQGYELFFRVTATMIPGPLIGGWLASSYGLPTVIDGKAGFIPTPLLFQVAAAGTLLAALPLFAAAESRKEA